MVTGTVPVRSLRQPRTLTLYNGYQQLAVDILYCRASVRSPFGQFHAWAAPGTGHG